MSSHKSPTAVRVYRARAGALLCAVFLVAAAGNSHAVDITTTNAYGIASYIRQEHPELNWVSLRGLRPVSDGYSVADVIAQNSKLSWSSTLYGFFLVNTSSDTLVKPIAVLRSDAETVTLYDAGNDFITVLQQSMHGVELARDAYFFDISADSPIKKYGAKTVSISVVEPFGPDLFFAGTIGKEGIIVKMPMRDKKIDPANAEISTRIAGAGIAPIVLAKGEGGLLRMYAHNSIYVWNGKNWSAINKASDKYFRSANPCSDIPMEKLVALSSSAYMAGYDQCERQRYENGDAWRVGYAGKCETIPPGKDGYLPGRYDGIFERWDLSSHIVELSSAPLHRFLVWNGPRNAHGVFEIEAGQCRFYPMPSPDKATLTSFRPGNGEFILNTNLRSFQELDGLIWLCPDFYDSDGYTGLGGIGYFDLKERKYEVYYSSRTNNYGCSALLAEKGKIWTGQRFHPEGLASFDTSSKEIDVYAVPEAINIIRRVGDSLIMGTQNGIYALSRDGKVSFLGPRLNKDGQYQMLKTDF